MAEYKWLALSVTSLGSLLSILDGTIFIIALPVIMRDLNVDVITIAWVIMGYMFILTILTPAFGRVADMMGRKKMYLWGFVVFTIASLFCGTSQSGGELLVFRMMQAVGGAMLVANSVAIVTDAFPRKELGTAMGINSAIFGIGGAVGPVLGGLLLQFGWRTIFFINIPTGALGTIWGAIQLKEVLKFKKQKFDGKGTIAFAAGMMGTLITLSFGGLIGWLNPIVLIMLGIGIAGFVLFIHIENKAEFPMMDFELFKSSRLAYGYVSALLNAIARGALTFLLTFYLQIILEMDPISAAIYLTPFAVAQAAGAPISGRLADKHGSQRLTMMGLLISAVGLFGFLFITDVPQPILLITCMVLMGLGSGFFFSPNGKLIMQEVPPHKRGIATSVRSMLFNAGNVISLGLALAIISSTINSETLKNLFIGAQTGRNGVAVEDFINGIRIVFLISFIMTVLAAVISGFKGKAPVWTEVVPESPQEAEYDAEVPENIEL